MNALAAQLARETPLTVQQVEILILNAEAFGVDMDTIEQILRSHTADPGMALSFAIASAAANRSVAAPTYVWCGWRRCELQVLDGQVIGGIGEILCGCDNLPGWNSPYLAGMPKPQVPAKARGRHGSRIQRSNARRASWRRMCTKYGNGALR